MILFSIPDGMSPENKPHEDYYNQGVAYFTPETYCHLAYIKEYGIHGRLNGYFGAVPVYCVEGVSICNSP